jgi:hypothetical protein
MADAQTRLQALMERMAKLDEQKATLIAEAEAEKAIEAIGADLAGYLTKTAASHKVDIKALNGKFFALNVGEDGKLAVSLATKASGKKSGGNGNGGNGGNGGDFEYFLTDGRGPFESVQKAMDAMNVPAADRPSHNRWDRLSKDWQAKIDRKPKATGEAEGEAEGEATSDNGEATGEAEASQ